MSSSRRRLIVLALIAQIGAAMATAGAQEALTPGSFKAYAADGSAPRVSAFSGLPVPRYASLKYAKVNGRAGPSRDYRILWTYERAGLPVVVIRESGDWRKIRDPMGDEVWVARNQLADERTAITMDQGVIHGAASANSRGLARFAPGAVVLLGACPADWCQVEAGGQKGWVLRSQLWGTAPLPAPQR